MRLWTTALVYALTCSPIAGLLGFLIHSFSNMDDEKHQGTPLCGFPVVGSYMGLVILGYLIVATFALRSTERWRFPVLAGVIMSLFTMGPVENTTDVVGRYTSHRHEGWLLAGSTLFWAIVATLLAVEFEHLFRRFKRRSEN